MQIGGYYENQVKKTWGENIMRAGIITFHCPINYGAILQAKALPLVLEDMGIRSEIINYRLPHDILSHTNIYEQSTNYKVVIKNIIKYAHRKDIMVKLQRFEKFYNEYLPVSKKIYRSIDELKNLKEYDFLICGSDQIWKPMNDDYLDEAFFLGFTSNAKKISYAPSFGIDTFPQKLENQLKILLSDFHAISVRERSGMNILRRIVSKSIKQVLDPTLLINKARWHSLSNMKYVNGINDYIVVYALERNKILNDSVKRLKQMIQLDIYEISLDGLVRVRNCDHVLYDVGPSEFISLIENAKLVLTNSFHGTAFSIIFEKPFISVAHTKSNSRILELLESLNISNRQISSSRLIQKDLLEMRYENVLEKLEMLKNNSIMFLKNACGDDNIDQN
jgi:hypothetical protein